MSAGVCILIVGLVVYALESHHRDMVGIEAGVHVVEVKYGLLVVYACDLPSGGRSGMENEQVGLGA